jgi:glutamate formiminotransferase/formiminotetrahydrofolate cyclodeaminase
MQAFGLPKGNDAEITVRRQAIQSATRYAIEVPFRVMQKTLESMEIIKAMVEKGNPNSITDAGVGMLCARAAITGAYMNVRINAASYDDKSFTGDLIAKGATMEQQALEMEKAAMELIGKAINNA